ncbi:MAG: hypothetical protein AAF282_23380 [Cyanobacteria bacterium P01_A01_bin.15]
MPEIATLFSQFRHQYADGSLTTELLMAHGEQYLVKATISVGEQAIATALAGNTSLAAADDQAKVRVLGMLGVAPPQQNGLSVEPSKPTPSPAIAPAEPAVVAPAPEPPQPQEPETSEESEADDLGRPLDSITPDEAPAPSEVPASALAAAALEHFDDSNPVDLSDIIAQTDVEMSRLGWSSVQGRTYLEQAFNKRSRQQLTDEELLTFLLYLESQATPSMG